MNLALSLVIITALCAIAAVVMDVRMSRAVATRLPAWAFYLEAIRKEKRGWADRSRDFRLKLRVKYGVDVTRKALTPIDYPLGKMHKGEQQTEKETL